MGSQRDIAGQSAYLADTARDHALYTVVVVRPDSGAGVITGKVAHGAIVTVGGGGGTRREGILTQQPASALGDPGPSPARAPTRELCCVAPGRPTGVRLLKIRNKCVF